MTEQISKPVSMKDPEKVALNKRLETAFWGLFLIMLGGWAFVPKETVPNGLWSIGVGMLLLGLNAARYFNKIRMSGFTTRAQAMSETQARIQRSRPVRVTRSWPRNGVVQRWATERPITASASRPWRKRQGT